MITNEMKTDFKELFKNLISNMDKLNNTPFVPKQTPDEIKSNLEEYTKRWLDDARGEEEQYNKSKEILNKKWATFDEAFAAIQAEESAAKCSSPEHEADTNSVDADKVYITYDEIQNTINKSTVFDNKGFDTILCITRGGMIPAGMLAYKLGIKNIVCITAVSYNDDNTQDNLSVTPLSKKEIKLLKKANRILIVDDIIDSGDTIIEVSDYLNQNNIGSFWNFSIVTKQSEISDYTLRQMDGDPRWIVFQWDK